jgi:hypothetical protein
MCLSGRSLLWSHGVYALGPYCIFQFKSNCTVVIKIGSRFALRSVLGTDRLSSLQGSKEDILSIIIPSYPSYMKTAPCIQKNNNADLPAQRRRIPFVQPTNHYNLFLSLPLLPTTSQRPLSIHLGHMRSLRPATQRT